MTTLANAKTVAHSGVLEAVSDKSRHYVSLIADIPNIPTEEVSRESFDAALAAYSGYMSAGSFLTSKLMPMQQGLMKLVAKARKKLGCGTPEAPDPPQIALAESQIDETKAIIGIFALIASLVAVEAAPDDKEAKTNLKSVLENFDSEGLGAHDRANALLNARASSLCGYKGPKKSRGPHPRALSAAASAAPSAPHAAASVVPPAAAAAAAPSEALAAPPAAAAEAVPSEATTVAAAPSEARAAATRAAFAAESRAAAAAEAQAAPPATAKASSTTQRGQRRSRKSALAASAAESRAATANVEAGTAEDEALEGTAENGSLAGVESIIEDDSLQGAHDEDELAKPTALEKPKRRARPKQQPRTQPKAPAPAKRRSQDGTCADKGGAPQRYKRPAGIVAFMRPAQDEGVESVDVD